MAKAKDRHGYLDWPRRDVERATDPVSRPQRRRKNTRRWCRGREGVNHVLETRLSKGADYRLALDPNAPVCYRAEWWPHRWWCNHERYCVNCGKIIDDSLHRDCPDYTDNVTVFRALRTNGDQRPTEEQ